MFNLQLLSHLFILFWSTQTTCTKTGDKKLLRIVGGQSAPYGKYPYVVGLEAHEFIGIHTIRHLFCTGSVLTPTWTLSASHCSFVLEKKPNNTFVIRYGSAYPSEKNESYSKILKFVCHPSYRLIGAPTNVYSIENDIALLKTESVILPKYGRISAVDYMSLVGFKAVTVGFGITNYTSSNQQMIFSDTLNLNMPLQTLDVVIKRCSNDVLDMDRMWQIYPAICLARKCREAVSICSGDSGAPLIHNSRIIGVNSIGGDTKVDCSNRVEDRYKSNIVAVIIAASPFLEWIGNVIN